MALLFARSVFGVAPASVVDNAVNRAMQFIVTGGEPETSFAGNLNSSLPLASRAGGLNPMNPFQSYALIITSDGVQFQSENLVTTRIVDQLAYWIEQGFIKIVDVPGGVVQTRASLKALKDLN